MGRIIPDSEIKRVLVRVVDKFLIPKFRELGMNASGNWLRSVDVWVRDGLGIIEGPDYTEYLVRGRGPNYNQHPEAIMAWAVGYGLNVIKKWADDKGIMVNPIGVAYNIATEGTSWYKQGGTDLVEVLQSDEVLDFINKEIGDFVVGQITLELQRDISKLFK
jgi:hypothetical protein